MPRRRYVAKLPLSTATLRVVVPPDGQDIGAEAAYDSNVEEKPCMSVRARPRPSVRRA